MIRVVTIPLSEIAVIVTNDDADDLHRLAQEHGLRTFASIDAARTAAAQYVLHHGTDGLELLGPDDRPGNGVRSDFRAMDLRTGTGNCSRNQPLGRAVGKKTDTVIDATAGLGYDSVLLACMGFHVMAVERSPIVAALFADGMRRVREMPAWSESIDRIELVVCDAADYLHRMTTQPDAVYIDPMFPPKRKAALAPKRIRMVRELVGDDNDSAQLLIAARNAAHRVAVKRPSHAPPIADDRSHVIETKMVRYDVYIS